MRSDRMQVSPLASDYKEHSIYLMSIAQRVCENRLVRMDETSEYPARRRALCGLKFTWLPLRRSVLSVMVVMACIGWQSALATNFQSEFSEIDAKIVPRPFRNFVDAYPNARYFISGFEAFNGEWKYLRVESAAACDAQYCPTMIVHDRSDWKVALKASTKVEVVAYFSDGEFVQLTFETENATKTILQYRAGEKTLRVLH